ncbi:MAG: hypothetical protein ACKOTB_01515 [Planctomycetia bacterium]
MDAHFREYGAAIVGMQDTYGDDGDGRPPDFHDDTVPATVETVESGVVTGSIWDE